MSVRGWEAVGDGNHSNFQRDACFSVSASMSLTHFDQRVHEQSLAILYPITTTRQSMGRDGVAVDQYRVTKHLRRSRVSVGMSAKEVSKRLSRMRRSKCIARGRRRLVRISISQCIKNVNGKASTDRAEWREDATRWGRDKF